MRVLSLLTALKFLLLPVLSILYLGFCWTVYSRRVYVDDWGSIDNPLENLAFIKSGIATINILIITLATWPITALIIDVKAEEFFRSLRQSSAGHDDNSRGVGLATALSTSSLSLGTFQSVVLIFKRQSSLYFTLALVTYFVVLATSVLVPATLSVQEVTREVRVSHFEVAAIRPGSVAVPDASGSYWITDQMKLKLRETSPFIWADSVLNVSYSLGLGSLAPGSQFVDSAQYIVPLLTDFSPTTSARWFSDVFILQPSCSWQTANVAERANLGDSQFEQFFVNLPSLGITSIIMLHNTDAIWLWIDYLSARTIVGYETLNTTTGDVPHGGYSIWAFSQYLSNTTGPNFIPTVNATGLPTLDVLDSNGDVNRFAFLACSPNFSIQTMEVYNTGAELRVIPISPFHPNADDKGQTARQGNLDQREGDLFFTTLFAGIHSLSSQGLPLTDGNSQIIAALVFGWDKARSPNGPTLWSPMPISNITEMYTRYILSATRLYVTGALGTAEVPASVSERVIAFSVSLAYVIASTILLLVLNIVNILAPYRSGNGEAFNLLTIGSVLHESKVPAELARFKDENPGIIGDELNEAFEVASRNRILVLEPRAESGGADVLTIRSRNAL
ncbi:hypothetical protein AX16_005153 [Volvariella volvacea WC 439]|nr:hypothetical protein AX16_005153 [Volvariella volvacea WC 439]